VQSKDAKPAPSPKGKRRGWVRETIEFLISTLVALIAFHWAVGEVRYIPSDSMSPLLKDGDHIFVEKVSGHLNRPIERGDVLVFYPPPRFMHRWQREDWLTKLADMTGLPFLPYEKALIKRVIGLPGEEVRVVRNVGIFINGRLLDESAYSPEAPTYNLKYLSEIGGYNENGQMVVPYPVRKSGRFKVIVPPGHYFMMGDNRNDSVDSHVWGFLNQIHIIGKASFVFWRPLGAPAYHQTDK